MIAPFNPGRISAIVFDVDNTLTRGTNELKANVWEELFPNDTISLAEARSLYEQTGKGDRYNIAAHVLGESQADSKDNEKVLNLVDKFDRLSRSKIRERGLHKEDCRALLKLKHVYGDAMYIASATPQKVVEDNISYFEQNFFQNRSIFTKIFGTPFKSGKGGVLIDIAEAQGINPNEILMVGDGESDKEGALAANSQFIGISPYENGKWQCEEFPVISAVADLPMLLNIDIK